MHILMRCFLSLNFNMIFIIGPISANTQVSELEHSQESENIEDTIQDCIYFINGKYCYTVALY